MSQFRETPDSDVLYFLHLVQAALARVREILRPTRVEERLHPGVSAKSKHKLVRFALKLPFLPEPDTVEHQSNTLKCYPAPRVEEISKHQCNQGDVSRRGELARNGRATSATSGSVGGRGPATGVRSTPAA